LIGHRAQGVKEMLNRRCRPLVFAAVLFAVLSFGGIPARAQHMNE
jgi:hypothetical protein